MRIRPLLLATFVACSAPSPKPPPAPPTYDGGLDALSAHCHDVVGEPTVHELPRGVFVATGYDLANVTVIQTSEGRIVIDPLMSPARSREAKAALDTLTSGAVRAIIYTHSHIDHVGGASVWMEEGTEVWATDAFVEGFFAQYGRYLPAESGRGARQFGHRVDPSQLPCSALGRNIDLDAALLQGFVYPDHTFAEQATLSVGGVVLQLVAAPGETADQLFVHWPEAGMLWPGDNWYRAFPNLYTIRGTRPRPVDAWIDSLDAMRRLQPQWLVPSHTAPLEGLDAVEDALRDHRDAIQWVRDEAVRGANRGEDAAQLAREVGLPAHLAANPWLAESYGQVDWSVRAIVTGELGWFSGRAAELYPLAPDEQARRTVQAMGGADAVRSQAKEALAAGELRWAVHQLDRLDRAGHDVDTELAEAYTALAQDVSNSNGRAYLLQAAHERRSGVKAVGRATLSDGFVRGLSLERLFGLMPPRLKTEGLEGVHETLHMVFPDVGREAWLTVRFGVLQVAWDETLPGTPEPFATVTVDSATWRDLALERQGTASAIVSGDFAIDGNPLGVKAFFDRFVPGTEAPPLRKP